MYPGRSMVSADRWQERENYPSNQHSPSPGLRGGNVLPANLHHLRVAGSSSYAQYESTQKDAKPDIKYKGYKISRDDYIPVEDELDQAILHKRNRAIKGEKVIEDSNNHFEQTNPRKITQLHPSMRGLAQGYKRRGRKGKYAWRGQIEVVDQTYSGSSVRSKEEKRLLNLKALGVTNEYPRKRISTPNHKTSRQKGRASALTKEARDQIFDAPELQASNNQVPSFQSKPRPSKLQAETIHSDSIQRPGKDDQSQLNETQTIQSGNYEVLDYPEPQISRRAEYVDESHCMEEFANTTGLFGAGAACNGLAGMEFGTDGGNPGSNKYGVNQLTPASKVRALGPNRVIRTPGRSGQSGFRESGVTTLHENPQKSHPTGTPSSRQGDQKTPFFIDIGPVSTAVDERDPSPARRSSNNTNNHQPEIYLDLQAQTSNPQAQRPTPSTVTPGTQGYKHMVSQIAKVFEISEEEVLALAKSCQNSLQVVVSQLCTRSTVNICLGGEKTIPEAISAD